MRTNHDTRTIIFYCVYSIPVIFFYLLWASSEICSVLAVPANNWLPESGRYALTLAELISLSLICGVILLSVTAACFAWAHRVKGVAWCGSLANILDKIDAFESRPAWAIGDRIDSATISVRSHAKSWLRKSDWRRELGAAGNLAKARAKSAAAVSRQSGRQRRSSGSRPKAAASGGKSSNADGGGEPPRPRSLKSDPVGGCPISTPITATPQQLYTAAQLAALFACHIGTIRNLASSGKIPKPIQTLVGSRYTDDHIRIILAGKAAAKRLRGRPRIIPIGDGGSA